MATASPPATSDAAILNRVIKPRQSDITSAAARAWLKMDFDEQDRERMHELALKAQAGSLSAQQKADLDSYRRVGRMLDLMHSKARLCLKRQRAQA